MVSTPDVTRNLVELIQRASTDLPHDVVQALRQAADEEDEGSAAQEILLRMLENVSIARDKDVPLCQDTGIPFFEVFYPSSWSTQELETQIAEAIEKATASSYLRPNSVHSLTGHNPANNLGHGLPSITWHEWDRAQLKVGLLLKGGGSENVSAQVSLPNQALSADRDLEGVRKAVLHAVHQAQGRGCAPGILGVCIGGDRGQGYAEAKKQLFRPLDDVNPKRELAALEKRILVEANSLGIGPMGLGGKTTLLGVKIGYLHRHPASFFVTVSYMCWECRRKTLVWKTKGDVEYA